MTQESPEAVVTSATNVFTEWIDYNGHMNVAITSCF